MATRTGNKDWVLGVGLDISEVIKKYNKIDKKIKDLAALSSKASTKQNTGLTKVNRTLSRQIRLLEKRNRLAGKVINVNTGGGATRGRVGRDVVPLATAAGVVAATSTAIEEKVKKAPPRLAKDNTTKARRNETSAINARTALNKGIEKGRDLGLSENTLKKFRNNLKSSNVDTLRRNLAQVNSLSSKAEIKLKRLAAAEKKIGATPKTGIGGVRRFAEAKDKVAERADTALSKGRATRLSIGDSVSPALVSIKEKLVEAERQLQVFKDRLKGIKDKSSLNALNKKIRKTTTEVNRLTKAANKTTAAFKRQNRSVNGLSGSVNHLVRSYVSIFAIGAAIGMFFKLGEEMESLQASMLAASGSAVQAGKDFEFIRNSAIHLGINLKEATSGYTKLGAASRAANFSQEQTRNIFLAASESARAFGLNAQRTNLVFLAFTQILSKGKVSMEELRRQLGEQIPGAFQIAAKAMNVTTSELDKMVSSGKLSSEDFLPKFADELRRSVRETGALEKSLVKVQAERQRFVSAMQLNTSIGFDTGASGLASTFQNLAGIVNSSDSIFKIFGRTLGFTGRVLTNILGLLVPIVTVFTESLETMFNAFERASDVTVPLKKLTFIEAIFRELALASLFLQKQFLALELAILEFSESFGATDEEGERLAAQLKSLIPVLLLFGLSFKALRGALFLILSPLKAIKSIFGFFFKNTKIANKVLGEVTKKAGLFSKVVSPLKGLLFLLAARFGFIARPIELIAKAFSKASFAGKAFASLLKKSFGATIGVGLAGLDIITAEKDQKAKETAGFGGAIGGALLGAKIGSFLGPVGAFIGSIIGFGLGEIWAEDLFTFLKDKSWGEIGSMIWKGFKDGVGGIFSGALDFIDKSIPKGNKGNSDAFNIASSISDVTSSLFSPGESTNKGVSRKARRDSTSPNINNFVVKQELNFSGATSEEAIKDITKATEEISKVVFKREFDNRFSKNQIANL